MATHRAKVQCFHDAHFYEEGEEATFAADADVPEHFELIEAGDESAQADDPPADVDEASLKGKTRKGK